MSDPIGEVSEGTGTTSAEVVEQQTGPSAEEQEALSSGWSPQESWHGKPEDWVDAATFLSRGRQINHVLQASLKKERADRARLEQEVAAMRGTVAELADYRNKLEKTVYDRAMTDLKAQLRQARSEGNFEAVGDVEEAIDQLKENVPKEVVAPKVAAPVVEPPEFIQWRQRNGWYNSETNPRMVEYVDGVALNVIQSMQRQGRTPNPTEVLSVVDSRVREMFPQAFKQAPAMFEGTGTGAAGSRATGTGAKGFNSLPSDAKTQFSKFYDAGYYVDMKTRKPLPKADAQAEYYRDYQGGK